MFQGFQLQFTARLKIYLNIYDTYPKNHSKWINLGLSRHHWLKSGLFVSKIGQNRLFRATNSNFHSFLQWQSTKRLNLRGTYPTNYSKCNMLGLSRHRWLKIGLFVSKVGSNWAFWRKSWQCYEAFSHNLPVDSTYNTHPENHSKWINLGLSRHHWL